MPEAARKHRRSDTKNASRRPPAVREIETPPRPELDLRTPGQPWPQRRLEGKALRVHKRREAHGGWKAARDRPDLLELLEISNAGRQEDLVPLRMGRMAASPFAFL